MRIISGKWKGRQLTHFKGDHLRPTTDRVKESLFNILQSSWEGARILDLFSGTGNLSFESLSRGAREVVAVEQNPKSIEIILKNSQILEKPKELLLQKKDVFKFLQAYEGEAFDVVLADPPFTHAIAHDVMDTIAKSKVFKPETVIAIEAARRERLDTSYSPLREIDRREFGDKLLAFFQKTVE
ncbi:MAG: 16S rRNA (guanine(966)-N(2))-methyltransferase RsmD [Bdellovibrionales bacterium]|nr:16S rRNA (guanine(966)-N(2))-methyltransferase RsmD [Bdellovibrionales bacterium]